MNSKYAIDNSNLNGSYSRQNKLSYWLKSSHDLFKKLGDRVTGFLIESDRFQSIFNRQPHHNRALGFGEDYSFLIVDEDNNRAYVGGRDRSLTLNELVMLPNSSGYGIYQVEDICLLSSNMWVASVNRVLTKNLF